MSILRDFKKYMLQQKSVIRTASGAERVSWKDVMLIDVAVYKKNDYKTVASEKYLKATHTGLTRYRILSTDEYRLVDNDKVYNIVDCNTQERLTNLLLEVITNG